MKTTIQNPTNEQVAAPSVSSAVFTSPDVNIYETDHGYTLEAEMPGVTRERLEVTLENNALTLVGRRGDADPPGTALYRESRPADFRRVFELDPVIDAQKIRAHIHQGLLTLELPKTEAVKPRRIAVD
ncbi:MAG: Hsp20/alpha crystallin family protein [Verrucomicrobia bacterium]|nr:Hsp20/alpha crystallin family protein [Verrucomicrobiota bacterium]